MNVLTQASHQWAKRPDDERFCSLLDMRDFMRDQRAHSRAVVLPSKIIEARPMADNKGLTITRAGGENYFAPTHFAFGQVAQLAEAPAGYLRTMPSPIVADCINYGLQYKRAVEDVGLLLYRNGGAELRAATGPNYGRIWNEDIVAALIERFGDGANGTWRVPGEFGQAVKITKANTTLYASDRDMFVFLADEQNRIEIPNRRNGKSGTLARGFFTWNSEVGDKTMGIGTFLFDYACCNRMVWGADCYQEIRVRHTVSAPLRWLDEVQPVLLAYSQGSAEPVRQAVIDAQAKQVDDVAEFVASRFGKRMVGLLEKTHEAEEGRPIESLWDVVTAATAYARGVQHTDTRLDIERVAGGLLKLAA